MNPAHIHLMINHLPLFAAAFGGALLAFGLLRKQRALKSAGLVLGVVAGVGAFSAVQSGERAEDIVETYVGVNEDAIHDHEEAGEAAQVVVGALGLLSLLALFIPTGREQLRGRVEWLALVLFIASLGFVARAANLGGLIRHPEIQDGAPTEQLDSGDEDDIEHQ